LTKPRVVGQSYSRSKYRSYRTTFRTSTGGNTIFPFLWYRSRGTKVEIGQPTYRTSTYEAEANDEQLALNLDFIEELRNQSNMRNVAYKQRIAKYYDSGSNPVPSRLGTGLCARFPWPPRTLLKVPWAQHGKVLMRLPESLALALINFVIPRARPCLVPGMPITSSTTTSKHV
ncbi:unnamed protein product, partial [Prunus brigantina]